MSNSEISMPKSMTNLPTGHAVMTTQSDGEWAVVVRYGWPSQTSSQCAFRSRPTVRGFPGNLPVKNYRHPGPGIL